MRMFEDLEDILVSTDAVEDVTDDIFADIFSKVSEQDISEMTNDEISEYFAASMEDILDEALAVSLKTKDPTDRTNILFEGPAGIAKTARISSWARKNGINLKNLKAKEIDQSFFGVPVPDLQSKRTLLLSTDTLKDLFKPRSVLFLDEINTARPAITTLLYSLVNEHAIPAANRTEEEAKELGCHLEDGNLILDNLLFVVCAQNPDYYSGVNELPAALRARFDVYKILADKENYKNYLDNKFQKLLSDKRMQTRPQLFTAMSTLQQIIDALLDENSEFMFDNDIEDADAQMNQTKTCQPRDLSKLIETVKDIMCEDKELTKGASQKAISQKVKKLFLDKWNIKCNPAKYRTVKKIVDELKDTDDKANSVWKEYFGCDMFDSAILQKKRAANKKQAEIDKKIAGSSGLNDRRNLMSRKLANSAEGKLQ